MAPPKGSAKKTPHKKYKVIPSTKFVKANPKKNASILDFFKKAEDEDLFVGGPPVEEEEDEDEDEDEDAEDENEPSEGASGRSGMDCKAEGTQDGEDEGEEEAKVADSSALRKRKLSAAETTAAGEETPSKKRVVATKKKAGTLAGLDSGGEEVEKGGTSKKGAKTNAPPPKKPATKKVAANPFLDDSSDEEEEEGDSTSMPKDEMTVRDASSALPTFSIRDRTKLTKDPSLSRIPLLRHETSGGIDAALEDAAAEEKEEQGTVDEDGNSLDDLDDTAFGFGHPGEGQWGEEFREMRYMQEQARIEAEEAGIPPNEVGGDDGVSGDIQECCPICNGSLVGLSEGQATEHVNACLDGTPIPLPGIKVAEGEEMVKEMVKEVGMVDSVEVSKRFAKAAMPRPGQHNPIIIPGELGEGAGPSTSAFAKLMNGHAEDTAWATAAATETASRGLPAYKRTCPFYKIMPGMFICVDAFRYGAVQGCNAYFLSHFHSDHYVGLTANWTHGPIYCSKVTGSLVKSQLKTAEKYVVELEFDQKLPVPGTQGVTVTMIPANHCPGSSLFLFEKVVNGGKRTYRILHCGDFRACPAHIAHAELRPETIDAISGKTNHQKIDVCYLDTTYLNPRYSFPPQDEVVRSCAELCATLNDSLASSDDRPWTSLLRRREGGAPPGLDGVAKFFTKPNDRAPSPDKPKTPGTPDTPNAFTALRPSNARRPRLLVICGTYSIGKERICKAIALALNTKIFAPPSKVRIIHQLDDPVLSSLITSNPSEAQVHMQMLMEIRADTLSAYLEQYKRDFTAVVGFRPSGWNFRPANGVNGNLAPGSLSTSALLHGKQWRTRFGVGDLVPQRGSTKEAICFGVPYSEHSSFRELAVFLMALRVEKVVPTVNVGSEQSRKRMKGWIDRWLGERVKGGLVRLLEEDEGDEEKKKKGLWDGKGGKGGGVYW